MERETLLTMLLMIFGGCALQVLAHWPAQLPVGADTETLEQVAWFKVCLPALPILPLGAWLAGWALTQPDPVRTPLDPFVVVALWLPFGLLFLRALLRAGWALVREPPECGVSTVGFMTPRVLFSPFLARRLEEPLIRAALAHERAHGRHRDPLRIWVAQLITDLQWPWPQARRRLDNWLEALEWLRDEEARRSGTDGSDLAAAVLASVRFLGALPARERTLLPGTQLAHARLIGDGESLQRRIERLLAPLPRGGRAVVRRMLGIPGRAALWLPLLTVMLALGVLLGAAALGPLLGLTV